MDSVAISLTLSQLLMFGNNRLQAVENAGYNKRTFADKCIGRYAFLCLRIVGDTRGEGTRRGVSR